MATIRANQEWQRSLGLLSGTVLTAAIVGTLYWAQVVFVPVALAILMTFLLTPAVRAFERRGLGRAPAVMVVVTAALLIVLELGWIIAFQMSSLAEKFPDYTANIQTKIHSAKAFSTGFDRFQKMVDDIADTTAVDAAVAAPEAPPAVIVRPEPAWLSQWPQFIGSAAEVAAGAALVIILTVFGLIKREDLRNRFLRLIGHDRLAYTTRAVDEAAERVSRYLMSQAMINVGNGACLALGLAAIGVQYALLWGFLAAVLRYIPYLGPWLALIFPLTVSVAQAESWTQPALVLAVFLVLEILTNNVAEPLLFKRSMGVSEVAQLISAAFWGFLWGPVGLILSAPLTVCLLVLGKYVRQFEFLDVLLGDEEPLAPPAILYQRLLAGDEDDASQLVVTHAKETNLERLCDSLLLPALGLAKRDRLRDEIGDEDQAFVVRSIGDILDDVAEAGREADEIIDAEFSSKTASADTGRQRIRVLGCPGFDDADALALDMLRKILSPERWDFEVVPTEMLTAEVAGRAVEGRFALVCIGSIAPGGLAHTRYLCKRLRQALPNAKILVGRWGEREPSENQQILEAGADGVTETLERTRMQLAAWLPVLLTPANDQAKTSVADSGADLTSADPLSSNGSLDKDFDEQASLGRV